MSREPSIYNCVLVLAYPKKDLFFNNQSFKQGNTDENTDPHDLEAICSQQIDFTATSQARRASNFERQ